MRKIEFRTGYNYDADEASKETGLVCPPEEGKTQQQFKDESDINEIVRRFGLTGQVPESFAIPQSGDFTGITDFHEAMNLVRESQAAFMSLPGELRARFNNDPARLMQFLEDGRNLEEARELGLVRRPEEVTRDVAALEAIAKAVVPPPAVSPPPSPENLTRRRSDAS